MDRISILVVDDHPLIREGFVRLFEKQADLEVVGQAADGAEAVRLATKLSPDVITMDIGMPEMDGLQVTRQIKTSGLRGSVLMLTNYDDQEHMAASFDVGADGYLLKDMYGEELVQAVRAVHLGELVLDLRMVRHGVRALTSMLKWASTNGSNASVRAGVA